MQDLSLLHESNKAKYQAVGKENNEFDILLEKAIYDHKLGDISQEDLDEVTFKNTDIKQKKHAAEKVYKLTIAQYNRAIDDIEHEYKPILQQI